MKTLLLRVICTLIGCPDSVLRWGIVRHPSGDRTERELTETCVRCERVIETTTLHLEGEQWRP